MEDQMASSIPYEALYHVLSLISNHMDRNSVSLVCKSWYNIERWSRRHVFIGNCYAVSPRILTQRFTDVRCITIKGKHSLADFDFVPEGWGAHALPWIAALAEAYPAVEEIRLKRMAVADEGLELIGRKLRNLRSLVLCKCEGFSTLGLASIAANCRKLRKLDLCKSEVQDLGGDWISLFPSSFTSLEFLNVDCLKSELPYSDLERLVCRCRNLKTLRLNQSFSLEKLMNLLPNATQLDDLGIGLFTMEPCPKALAKLSTAFARYEGSLKSLSGLWDANPCYLPAIYPVCSGLTSLDLSHSTLHCPDLIKLLHHCPNLQCLSVLDYIEDLGLEEVAASCKELEELRVIYSDPYDADSNNNLITERGIISVVMSCPKLHYILYFCSQMTNATLLKIAKNNPNITRLRICILEPQQPDYLTNEPLDNGFIAIIKRCKNLRTLVTTGLITDQLLEQIGTHCKRLSTLHIPFGGTSDLGLHYILSGCDNLRKLSMRDCPFGDRVLLENTDKLERIESLWMSSCPVSYRACKAIAMRRPRLNVEVMNEKGPLCSISDDCRVENLYVYRTLAGVRSDMPAFVWSTNQKVSLG